ncbi:HAMP domain-containing sensor histidine kinase [Stenotrophomonas sp. S39]|uniref:sensor histidine kinase n=1 Tax=Stenotrophomonas sp. S39 TaxID=2767451 RepID=UPI00190B2EAA|nr:HAMP domain-containing sensor histidine kinase [Stenotrophomonas sp. S39]MBK0053089.1 HAMP domain-containing histidine kinase [Stenotrophomonas sp. S39]
MGRRRYDERLGILISIAFMNRRSLGTQLSWRVGVIQLVTFFASLAIFLAVLWTPGIHAVPPQLAKQVASAFAIDRGHLILAREKLPRGFLEKEGSAWLVARSSSGDQVLFGNVPEELRALTESLPRLEESQLRSEDQRLAATVVVQKRGDEKIWVMVGGTPDDTIAAILFVIGQFIFLPIFLPVLIATSVVIPLAIRSRLRALRSLADDAATIDLGQRGAALRTEGLPAEVLPLVASFNQALSRIWEASAARDRFLSDAAHELRMPMAVLRARMSSLPHSKEKLRLVGDLSRLETIAEQLLDLQRLGRTRESYNLINMTELCDNLAAEVAPLIIEHGYEFSFNADANPMIVEGDSGALERMLKNLLHNAINYGGQRGSIAFEVCSGGRITVSDSGPGVPEEERQRIFAPFYRLNAGISGSGLGLHLASEVATKHGGRIRVSDSSTGGATFEVLLPTLTATNSSRRNEQDGVL